MQKVINLLEVASELANLEIKELQQKDQIYIEVEGELRYTEEAQDLFNQNYDKYYSLLDRLSNNVLEKIVELKKAHYMLVEELDFPEFDESKYENNIDFIIDQDYENNDFNVGYEQARHATYNEIIRLFD